MIIIKKIVLMLLLCLYILPSKSYGLIMSMDIFEKTHNNDSKFKNIVFAGGGVLGIAYCGSLEAIDNKVQPLSTIENFAGTSVGSIVATMSALRYSEKEMRNIMMDLDFHKIAEEDFRSFSESKNIFGDDVLDLPAIVDLIRNADGGYGINNGQFLEEWIDGIIAKKTGKAKTTFSEMANTGKFANLYITASNISNQRLEIFSAKDTPNIVISQAVRASTSVPIFFDIMNINNNIYVDGGIYDIFPLNIFQGESADATLGINFVSHPLIDNQSKADNEDKIFNWEKYLLSLLNATFIAQDNLNIYDENKEHIIIINTLGMSPLNFKLTAQDKKRLFDEGYDSVIRWLDK